LRDATPAVVRAGARRRRCAADAVPNENRDEQTTSARKDAESFVLIKQKIPPKAWTEKLFVRKKGDRRPPVRLA
jgi:hypothetical protein